VRDVYGETGFELVDARGWDVWEGEPHEPGVTPTSRTGHIPHALPYDFREFAAPDGSLRSSEDTRATVSRLGPRPSSPVDLQDEFIVYGRGPDDGALGYYLLRRAGLAKVRFYPDGFDEWSSHPELPVTRIIHAEEILARLNREVRLLVPDTPPRSFVLFDVRHYRDYGLGHVPGAVNLQSNVFADSLDSALARWWPAVDRSSMPVVVYCYGASCIRSRNCSTIAARAGFMNTERFYGGIEEWKGIGAPVIRTLGE
jgi:3-mercaptopyruvate sulfurtransferase SseA